MHADALASLAGPDRAVLLRVLGLLAEGDLGTPSESPRPARRARR
ncbi:hypothetical protein [Streptomyces antarcticus]|nr:MULTISPECIES: hypothetical protein [unclassified Streptomyces]MCY0945459.1 hypothetical protein [Streptomyces sp. H34-AA3]MCZ4084920.1 hypothetical protein [Streptomyces sp. H34-S5]